MEPAVVVVCSSVVSIIVAFSSVILGFICCFDSRACGW